MNNYAKPVVNEFNISGTVLAVQIENLSWNDKNTGLARTGVRFSIILQGDYGIIFCRAFNPSENLSKIKAGDLVYLPIDKFEKENGMKVATLNRGI